MDDKEFLPQTQRRHDRPGNPDSHYWYLAPNTARTKRYEDPTDGTVLLEVRSNGGQTVVPPSVHPSGETLRWIERGPATKIEYQELRRAAAKLAAAVLLANHWPEKGSRDEAAMALAGAFTRAGWDAERTDSFLVAVAEAAGDEEARTRAKAARTVAKQNAGGNTYGWPRVIEIFGKPIVDKITEWLAFGEESTWSQTAAEPVVATSSTANMTGLDARLAEHLGKSKEEKIEALRALGITGHKKKVDNTAENVCRALEHLAGEDLALDERAGVITYRRRQLDEGREHNHLAAAVCRFFGWDGEPAVGVMRRGIAGAAALHAFDPVAQYLEGLKSWDGYTRTLDLAKALGADDAVHDADILGKWMIGAVRRVRQPGVKMDNTLVLVGPQGVGKTSAIAALAEAAAVSGDTVAPLFVRASTKVADKDALMRLQGPWLVELAELATIKGAENEMSKPFLDECQDYYRAPYAATFVRRPRRVVFAGTTNDQEYLTDATGARRYWLIEVTRKIDLDWIRANADALWAEADARAKAGEAHWYGDTPDWMLERHEAAHEEGSTEDLIEKIAEEMRRYFTMSEFVTKLSVKANELSMKLES